MAWMTFLKKAGREFLDVINLVSMFIGILPLLFVIRPELKKQSSVALANFLEMSDLFWLLITFTAFSIVVLRTAKKTIETDRREFIYGHEDLLLNDVVTSLIGLLYRARDHRHDDSWPQRGEWQREVELLLGRLPSSVHQRLFTLNTQQTPTFDVAVEQLDRIIESLTK